MEVAVRDTCLKELEFQILDSEETITSIKISNDWSIKQADAVSILESIVEKFGKKENLQKNYLVRGIAKDSNHHHVSVVPQEKLEDAQRKLEQFQKTLFSVSKAKTDVAENYKMDQPQLINLPFSSGQRHIEAIPVPVDRPYVEKKKPTLFPAVPEKTKKESPPEKKAKKEAEPTKNGGSSKEPTPVKKESKSPTKSPEKGSGSKGKAKPKVQQGKASIASFFGSKPAEEKTPAKSATVKVEKESPKVVEVKKKKEEEAKEEEKKPETKKTSPKDTEAKEEATNARKRDLSVDPPSDEQKATKNSEPSNKKMKSDLKKKKMMANRSRIMQLCDSDSSDGEREDRDGKRDNSNESDQDPGEKMEQDVVEKEERVVEKEVADENTKPSGKRRFKATRKVNRTYEDEDGFFRTVRETEEYSCSEEEPETATTAASAKQTAAKKEESAKPAVAPLKVKGNTKQGSIMSFFSKR